MKIGLIGAQGKMGKAISQIEPNCYPIFHDTPRTNLDCDVLIDVSTHKALEENLEAKRPIVIGTTGHLDFTPIQKAAKDLPVFFALNFSIGALLLSKMANFLNKTFPADIDLIEVHHKTKKDTPSGTALHLIRNLPDAKIHSIRSAQEIGEHTLIFNNAEEKITLSHQVHTREAFAKGALLAAQFIKDKPPGLYTMDHLIKETL